MQWREIGSVRLEAPRDHVFDVLSRWIDTDPQMRAVSPERFESRDARRASTFILREDEQGHTRVIHARTEPMVIGRGRSELRGEVEAELERVERLVKAYSRP